MFMDLFPVSFKNLATPENVKVISPISPTQNEHFFNVS